MKTALRIFSFFFTLTLLSVSGHAQGIKDTLVQIKDVSIIAAKDSIIILYCPEIKYTTVRENVEIESSQGKRISDVITQLSPSFVKSYGAGQLASPSINGGSAAQTDVLWNGIKINSPATGQVDLSLFDLGTIDDLSISSGGHGANIGGSINLNNELLASSDTFQSRNVLRYGSFNSLSISSAQLYNAGRFSGSSRIDYIRSDNDFSFKNDTRIGAPLQREPNGETDFLAFMQQLKYNIKKDFNVGLNFWLTNADRHLPPVMTSDVSTERQYDQSYRFMAYAGASKKNFNFSFKSAYIYDRLHYADSMATIDSRSFSHAFRNIFKADYLLKQKINFGLEAKYDYESVTSSGFDHSKMRDIAGLSFSTFYLYKSYSKIGFELNQEIAGSKAMPFTARMAWIHTVFSGNSIFNFSAIAARAYRLPSLNDLYWSSGGNPDLRTEKAWNGNVSANYRYRYLRFLANGFCNYVTDWILWHPAPSGIWTPDNVKRVLSRGINLSVKIESSTDYQSNKFMVFAYLGYSYTKTTSLDAISVNDNSAGKQLIYVPVHNASATIQLQYYNFYIRSVSNLISERFTTTDNSQSLKSFYLTHIEVGKDFYFHKQQIGFSFRVNNLIDSQYQVVELRPMPGRSYEGTVRINLKK